MNITILGWLAGFIILLLLIVCRAKGLRSLLSLAITIIFLVFIIIPLILKGFNPTLICVAISLPLIASIMYLTEGFILSTHLALGNILIVFLIMSGATSLVILLAHFSGLTSEEAAYVASYGTHTISLTGLLTAGILLGTLGALTEMVTTQVATVFELSKANPLSTGRQLFTQAYSVGSTHVGSMINTLFLIYAGESLPVLIILIGGHSTLSDLGHSELLAAELARILLGVLALILSLPLSTATTAWWLTKKLKK